MSEQSTDRIEAQDGLVKWFDTRKGFGFIIGPDEQDIFVHYTVIEGDGFRALKDNSPVTYDAEKSDKGWRATKVVAIIDEADAPEVVVRPKRTYTRTNRQ